MHKHPSGAIRFRELQWDSQQLGVTCGLIDLSNISSLSSTAAFQKLSALLKKKEEIAFVTIKLSSNLAELLNHLAIKGLNFVDTEIIFRFNSHRRPNKQNNIQFVKTIDPEPFLPLAGEMRWSRFFLDVRIPKSKSVGLWENSIRNHCSGKARFLAVAFKKKRPAGLVTICQQSNDPEGLNLFLVGVLPEFQRQGIGRKLISAATNAFGDQYDIQVEASARNRPAIRLYQSCGFEMKDIRYILHLIR